MCKGGHSCILKKLKLEALVLDVEGTWRELKGVVGKLAAKHLKQNLSRQSHWEDLSKQIEVRARDEILDFKNTVNGMIMSVGGGCHSSHFRSQKSRQTMRSSTCIGRGRTVVEFATSLYVASYTDYVRFYCIDKSLAIRSSPLLSQKLPKCLGYISLVRSPPFPAVPGQH
ncbi:hypothetical protein BYT27DRAFT_7265751 [Phlegmacium glaucopus]|nr:hypothetical protein BYT27DRAFT_7265751 [Phlegmacium glaucopus]